jgi:hypothetical protein
MASGKGSSTRQLLCLLRPGCERVGAYLTYPTSPRYLLPDAHFTRAKHRVSTFTLTAPDFKCCKSFVNEPSTYAFTKTPTDAAMTSKFPIGPVARFLGESELVKRPKVRGGS